MQQRIKETFVAPNEVFVTTAEDGTRYVSDRFIAWRLDAMPAKAHAALTYLADGWYAISTTGATSPAKGRAHSEVPRAESIAGMMDKEPGETATMTGATLDIGSSKLAARLYVSESGATVGMNSNLSFVGYELRMAPNGKQFVIVKNGETVGLVMHVRIADELDKLLNRIAPPVAAVA